MINNKIHPALIRKRYAKVGMSQNGECGIIQELISRLNVPETCIEFGAGDGKILSNTYKLWHDKKWSALLIEADHNKFKRLRETTSGLANVVTACEFVSTKYKNTLQCIMSQYNFSGEIGVLSIDVDSNDLEIFESLTHSQYHIVVIEFNFEFPASIDYRDPPDLCLFRHSAKATLKSARSFGFEAVCCVGANLILVNTRHHALDWLERDVPIEDMFDNTFRLKRMRNPEIVRSKFTTRAAVYAVKPRFQLRARLAVSNLGRTLRNAHHAPRKSKQIPDEVKLRLSEAGLYF